uniref:Uncharacterized protein n=1 Tax=viral metagenome TaxID=1070528 RepID=A0A6H1ZAI9_9ZZZZ
MDKKTFEENRDNCPFLFSDRVHCSALNDIYKICYYKECAFVFWSNIKEK